MKELKEILTDSPAGLFIIVIIGTFIIGSCKIVSDLISSFGGCNYRLISLNDTCLLGFIGV